MTKFCDNRLRKLVLVALLSFLTIVAFLGNESLATQFFKKSSTWYQKIPDKPRVMADSQNYVNYILSVTGKLQISYREWSVPVWRASSSTPKYTVTVTTTSQLSLNAALNNGWNKDVPVPPEAKQAGYGMTGYRDGHMVIISADGAYAWDFFQAQVDAVPITTNRIRRWSLADDGTNQPYTGGSCRVSPVPLLQGLITYEEMQRGYIDHALAFSTSSAQAGSTGVYPCVTTNSGTSTDPWAPHLGFRFQLDPSVDINSLGLNAAGKIIAKALQEYGMIFVENTSPGTNAVYAESLDNKSISWDGIFGSTAAWVPLDKIRLVEPVYVAPSGLLVVK